MSDIYSITRGQLEYIADAIRLKTGKSAKMTVAEMPNEINSIEPGGGGGLIYTSNCIAMSNGIILPSTIGIARIPTPYDCPFNCNVEFLGMNNAEYIVESSGDGSRTYQRTKYSDSKYVIVIAVHRGGYNNILYISPDKPDAVEFQADNYYLAASTDSYTYNGTTWYFSSTNYAIIGEMIAQGTTAPIYPETVTLNDGKYSDASKEAILQYVGASLKLTPNDCPFTCNLTYFMDSLKKWTIASATYEKNNANYAVGVCLQIAAGGEQWTAPVLMSTDINAVKYSVNGTDYSQDYPPKSFQYNDGENTATWYYSVCYGQPDWNTPNGMVMLNSDYHPSTIDAYLNDSEVQSILQLMQVKNKPIQGGRN